MKKVFALILALTMLCSVAFAADTDIAILVPNADHGWTGAVMTYAEEKAAAVNEEGTYTAQVITSSDPANQITQVEDIIENQSANTVVILPQDNTLEVTMRRLADSGIPFVPFGESLHDEMACLNEAGIPAADILKMVSRTNARVLGLEDQLGSLEVGKKADIVLLGSDPVKDIHNTRDIRLVLLDGHVAVDRMG